MIGRCLISEPPADRFELLRRRYRPVRTSVLFVGESRPAGGTFFYAGNSHLFRYTAEAFGYQAGETARAEQFLTRFMELGCYLVDLCPVPVNILPARAREVERSARTAALAVAIRSLQPNAVVNVMKGIRPHVEQAIHDSQVRLVGTWHLPFPAQGHQREYVAELQRVLAQVQLVN